MPLSPAGWPKLTGRADCWPAAAAERLSAVIMSGAPAAGGLAARCTATRYDATWRRRPTGLRRSFKAAASERKRGEARAPASARASNRAAFNCPDASGCAPRLNLAQEKDGFRLGGPQNESVASKRKTTTTTTTRGRRRRRRLDLHLFVCRARREGGAATRAEGRGGRAAISPAAPDTHLAPGPASRHLTAGAQAGGQCEPVRTASGLRPSIKAAGGGRV